MAGTDAPAEQASSTLRRRVAVGALLLGIAATASEALHLTFVYGQPMTMMPWIFIILLAHWIFVTEVADAPRRKTSAGMGAGLMYFAGFLGALVATYGKIFSDIGLHDSALSRPETHELATGIYFSVVTWTTVGYGDVTATLPAARFFAAAEALNGYLVLALFIAALVPIFQQLLQGRDRNHGPP